MKKKISGVVVPMITPFNADGTVDTGSTGILVRYLAGYGTAPFLLGTTGESASVPGKEKQRLVEAAVQAAGGSNMIYAGISGNSIMDVIDDARRYHDLGAGVFVSTMASYYPADDAQMLRYFTMLADNLPGPLIIYNIPATTHLSLPLEVVDLLSAHPNIVGFKDSERSIGRLEQSVALWKDRTDFSFLTGWAAQSLYAMQLGADGIVPGTGNLAPGLYTTICKEAVHGAGRGGEAAMKKADQLSEMYQEGRSLSYALPVLKAMMSAYGLCKAEVLPPMLNLPEKELQFVRDSIKEKFSDLDRINRIEGFN